MASRSSVETVWEKHLKGIRNWTEAVYCIGTMSRQDGGVSRRYPQKPQNQNGGSGQSLYPKQDAAPLILIDGLLKGRNQGNPPTRLPGRKVDVHDKYGPPIHFSGFYDS